jgi:asparagine synthase (glutamine-hydrolysing)
VVLTGEGGDELFAGYPTYFGHRYARLAGRLPESVRRAAMAFCARIRPSHHHLTIPYFIERFLDAAALPAFERHVAWFGTASPNEVPSLLAPDLRNRLSKNATRSHLERVAHSLENAPVGSIATEPRLLAYQLLDFELYLGGGLLTKVDRSTMDHGLEARAPFLQPELIRFAFDLPESLRLRGRTGKWVLKEAARGLLPDEIIAQRKKGFSPPFSAWIRGPLRHAIRERLSAQRVHDAGVLDPRATSSLVAAHLDGRVERSRTIWALLSLQMWAERWGAAASGAASGSAGATREVRNASPSTQHESPAPSS